MLDKLNQKSAVNAGKHLVSGTAGVAASGALAAVVPAQHKKMAKIGMLIGSTALLMATQGTAKTVRPISFFLGGVAVNSTVLLAKEYLANKIDTSDTASTTDKAFAGALGLGCPGGSCGNTVQYRALRQPSFETTFRIEEPQMASSKSYR